MTAPSKRSFRLPEVVLGLLLVAGCALAAVVWQQRADTTTTVVVAKRDIARGSVITVDDLRGAEVGGETDAMISGADAQQLLGQTAVVDIDAGAPLTPTLLTDATALGGDEALTSMALAPGQYPPDLAPTDRIRLVLSTAGEAGDADETTLVEQPASVWSIESSPDGVSTVVTIRGPIDLAMQVAAATSVLVVRIAAEVSG